MTHPEKHSEIDKALALLDKDKWMRWSELGTGKHLGYMLHLTDADIDLINSALERAKADLADGEDLRIVMHFGEKQNDGPTKNEHWIVNGKRFNHNPSREEIAEAYASNSITTPQANKATLDWFEGVLPIVQVHGGYIDYIAIDTIRAALKGLNDE